MTEPPADLVGPALDAMWADLAPIGRAPSGGYHRYAWSAADRAAREWFTAEAERRGLSVEVDRNGNLWAWWGDPDGAAAVVTGSHLDSVPDGGPYDGPLGVVSALLAVDELRHRGATPRRPLGVVVWSEEEGARFGVACAGSRLLTGALAPDRARALADAAGTTLAEAMTAAGHDPRHLGRDDATLRRIGHVVELHVEQGRGLVHQQAPVGVASGIWPHGRWRLDLVGEANHAGTTALADRRDPMLDLAGVVRTAREAAERHAALATVGRVAVEPNATNAVPALVRAWLDARAADESAVREVVALVGAAAGTQPVEESWSGPVHFPAALRDRVAHVAGRGVAVPVLATWAGHDAGVLAAAGIPTAMLFVRNPTGVSHSPAEHAERSDCVAGVLALADVLADLLADPDGAPGPTGAAP